MNLMIHQFKKDARRLRPYLILWLVPVAWGAVQFFSSLLMDLLGRPAGFHLSGSMINLSVLVSFLIVPLLIQEDSLVDNSAFWLARPISRMQLWREKTAFLGLLILLMMGARCLELLSAGAPAEEMLHQALLFFLKTTAVITFLALVSAVTPDLKKFFLYAVLGPVFCLMLTGLVAGITQFGLMLAALMLRLLSVGSDVSVGMDFSGGFQMLNGNEAQDMITLPLVILVGFGLFCHQYLTRNSRVTISLAMAALPMAVMVQIGYFFALSLWGPG